MIVLWFFCLLYNNLALSFLTKYNNDAAINIESCIIHTHWKYNIIQIWTNVYKNLQYSIILFKLLIIINYFLNKSYIKFCMFQFFILPLFLFWLFKYILTQFHCQSTTVESAVALLNISWLNFLKLSNICKIYIILCILCVVSFRFYCAHWRREECPVCSTFIRNCYNS